MDPEAEARVFAPDEPTMPEDNSSVQRLEVKPNPEAPVEPVMKET